MLGMVRLLENFIKVICDDFCRCRGNECGEDTPCFLEDVLVECLRKYVCQEDN